ncbi:MAG: DNA mismatch repair endonuclease MutL, partial [Clostridiales bacterium]|nr:DNA mismatch repair endonuclease MutL [Clostridiales bacterium]
AGEVVERPAAAIKELVENSMDAGATAITVEIREGGISYFRVGDNGKGIPPAQVRMAFERHATSKIHQEEDLYAIATLGFRGEALASIAAVSQVSCTTRTKNEDYGVKVVNHGGEILSIEEASSPEGTTIIVENLFYNTPVRLKFLKKPAYEAGLVSDYVMRLILSRPDISFRFINNGKVIYHSPGDGKMDSAIFSIYGREMLVTMRYVSGAQNGLMVKGYIGIGENARGNRSHQSFFINDRYMRNPALSRGLEQGTRERVTVGHFPVCVLYITMPYHKVDVNVHPNKLEVRFQDENEVVEAIRDIVFDAFQEDHIFKNIPKMELTSKKREENLSSSHQVLVEPSVKIEEDEEAKPILQEKDESDQLVSAEKEKEPSSQEEQVDEKERLLAAFAQIGQSMETNMATKKTAFKEERFDVSLVNQQKKESSIGENEKESFSDEHAQGETLYQEEEVEQIKTPLSSPLRVLGVVFRTYILLEYEEQLLLIDQHAAHERLLYDQYMEALNQHLGSQQLLVPLLVSLTFKEQTLLLENKEVLQEAGFEIEPFGENGIQLRGVPIILGEPQAKTLLLEIVNELETAKGLHTIEKRRSAIIQMACKRAVKSGDVLPMVEIEDLVDQMIVKGVTPTCPHGRPLVIAITRKELDKWFKRIQ